MINQIPIERLNFIKNELEELDKELLELQGKKVKPSTCYYFESNPAHILFNTNCPDSLKEKIQGILHKYISDESGSQEHVA